MALANGGLDGPDFRRRKNAGEGRVLAQTAAWLGISFEDVADVTQRPIKNSLPFVITANERGSIRILVRPTDKIIARNLEERWFIPKPGGNTPPNLQAYFVMHLVLHGAETSSRTGLIQQQKELSLRHCAETPSD